MKIRITRSLPISNPPTVGSIHEVIRVETEPPRYKRTRMYFIEIGGREIGVYPHECEKTRESEGTNNDNGSGGEAPGQSV